MYKLVKGIKMKKPIITAVPNNPLDKKYTDQLNKMYNRIDSNKLHSLVMEKFLVPTKEVTLEDLRSLYK